MAPGPAPVSARANGTSASPITARSARESCMLGSMETEELPPGVAGGQDTRAVGRSLIDTFGRGWAKADIDILVSVFAPDAIFVETPFSEPIRGMDAVRRWWLDVPYSQSEISF